ncbi:hypothetical protein GYB22_00660 [bacterium]|nr:hypothetical protein [bacterium]
MLKSPVWVSLLVACADQHLDEHEIETAKKIVHVKTFSEASDVRNLYTELDHNIDATVETESAAMPQDPKERIKYFEAKLAQLNDILPKLEHTYAVQFYKSLKNIALHIAKSEGGVLGIGNINDAEEHYLDLPMIQKP